MANFYDTVFLPAYSAFNRKRDDDQSQLGAVMSNILADALKAAEPVVRMASEPRNQSESKGLSALGITDDVPFGPGREVPDEPPALPPPPDIPQPDPAPPPQPPQAPVPQGLEIPGYSYEEVSRMLGGGVSAANGMPVTPDDLIAAAAPDSGGAIMQMENGRTVVLNNRPYLDAVSAASAGASPEQAAAASQHGILPGGKSRLWNNMGQPVEVPFSPEFDIPPATRLSMELSGAIPATSPEALEFLNKARKDALPVAEFQYRTEKDRLDRERQAKLDQAKAEEDRLALARQDQKDQQDLERTRIAQEENERAKRADARAERAALRADKDQAEQEKRQGMVAVRQRLSDGSETTILVQPGVPELVQTANVILGGSPKYDPNDEPKISVDDITSATPPDEISAEMVNDALDISRYAGGYVWGGDKEGISQIVSFALSQKKPPQALRDLAADTKVSENAKRNLLKLASALEAGLTRRLTASGGGGEQTPPSAFTPTTSP